MKSDINFLAPKKSLAVKQKSNLRIIRMLALIMLFVIPTFSFILFILTVSSPIAKLQASQDVATATLTTMHPKIVKLLFINKRLGEIQQIIAQRSEIDQSIDAIENQVPPNLSLDLLTIKPTGMDFTAKSNSLFAINQLLTNLQNNGGTHKAFHQITLSNVTIDTANKVYLANLSISLSTHLLLSKI